MAMKCSEWMRGLLVCEAFIKHSGLPCATLYAATELWQDSIEFQRGWFDALAHYERLRADS